MAVNVCVSTSGPVLSFLLYENVNSITNQEGFLLGEIVNKETNTISDFQINGKETATLISIHSIMPLPNKFSFYNHIGKVNAKKLKDILKEKAKEVVGWFRFRRNTTLTPHLFDKILHQQLSEILLPLESRDVFVMCILSSSKSSNESTHRFNHAFYTYKYSEFEAIPLNIENLGDTSVSGYKVVSNTACSSESFQNIITSLKVGHEKFSEAQLVLNMEILLKKHLQKLVHDLSLSEARISSLQKEVDLLKAQLKSGKVSNELLLPQLLSMPVEAQSEKISNNTVAVPLSNHTSVSVRSDMKDESELPDKTNGNEEVVISSDICIEENEKEKELTPSPPATKATGDPFDFVTELKNKMTPPAGGRRHGGTATDSFPTSKGNSASGVTGAKRKQSARACPSSPSPGSVPSSGDTIQGKGASNRQLRSSPQRSVRKVSTPESQRQIKTRQSATVRSNTTATNTSQDN